MGMKSFLGVAGVLVAGALTGCQDHKLGSGDGWGYNGNNNPQYGQPTSGYGQQQQGQQPGNQGSWSTAGQSGTGSTGSWGPQTKGSTGWGNGGSSASTGYSNSQ